MCIEYVCEGCGKFLEADELVGKSPELWHINGAGNRCGIVVNASFISLDDYEEEDEFWLEEDDEEYDYEPEDTFMSDVEADADTLRSIGFGTDEDYFYYGGDPFEN